MVNNENDEILKAKTTRTLFNLSNQSINKHLHTLVYKDGDYK